MLDQTLTLALPHSTHQSHFDGVLHQAIQQRLESRFACTPVEMDLDAFHRLIDEIL